MIYTKRSIKIANQVRNFLSLTFIIINLCSLYNTDEICFSIVSSKFTNPKDGIQFCIFIFIQIIYQDNNNTNKYNFQCNVDCDKYTKVPNFLEVPPRSLLHVKHRNISNVRIQTQGSLHPVQFTKLDPSLPSTSPSPLPPGF